MKKKPKREWEDRGQSRWVTAVLKWMVSTGYSFAGLGSRMEPPMTGREVALALDRDSPQRGTLARFERATGLRLGEGGG